MPSTSEISPPRPRATSRPQKNRQALLALERCRGPKGDETLFILSDDKASDALGSKRLGAQDKQVKSKERMKHEGTSYQR